MLLPRLMAVRGRGIPMRKKYSRRSFLKVAGAGLAGASLLGAAGCGGSGSFYSPSADMWKQFSGTTLNFVSENTAPTTAIAANLNGFKELTGINVNVLQLELGALVQKVALDIGSGEGAYQVVYADPYQIMAPYYEALADLGEFNDDDDLPSIPKGTDDFIPT
jgi:multiple sugar transport system substrate-binding protein